MAHRFGVVTMEPMIDLFEITDALKEEQGMDYRDMAGKYSAKARDERDALREKWLSDNGYEGFGYVLNNPEGSNIDWAKDSVEMTLRIEINTKMREDKFYEMLDDLYPYQDVWHYLLDNDFCELHRGGANTLYLGECKSDPDYIARFRKAALELVKGHPAFDEDEEWVVCYIDW